MATKLPLPSILTQYYIYIYKLKFKAIMKHRTHKDFPSYRFYSDGRIKNKTTNHFMKVKARMKLVDA